MKRLTAIILSMALLAVLLCGCKADNDNDDDSKLNVVTTIFPPYDFIRQIGGSNVNVSMLLKPGTESHNYDPTPQDIIKIQDADLFVYVGGESDEWVRDILEADDKQPKKVVALTDCVDTVQEDITTGMTVEEKSDSDKTEYDEHVWTSPKNALTISRKLAEALGELDGKNKSVYEKNMLDYARDLSALDNDFCEAVSKAKNKTLIFADRFPMRYFADVYGLGYFAAFAGCSSDMEPSAATISFLIDKVREKKIPVVFTIEFSNGKIADTICEATGAKKLEFHSCHNVSQKMFDDGATYISIMRNNLKNLKEALA